MRVNRADLRFPFPRVSSSGSGARVLRLDGAASTSWRRWTAARPGHPPGHDRPLRIELPTGALDPGGFAHAASVAEPHAHVVFETDAGARLTYFDARRFGSMDLVADGTCRLLRRSRPWGRSRCRALSTPPISWRSFAGRRQAVKTLLLDQSIVAGLGNIYVCEALYRAGSSFDAGGGALPRARLKRLVGAVRAVLEAAIAAGGSTLRDYARWAASLGYFQHAFRVYGREGEPCETRGCRGVIARQVQGGRSTFYCPRCQT